MIRLENVTHSYGPGNRALDAVSLVVPEGECFGLIGANGAGKSTLIRILSTLLRPTSGRAFIGDNDVVGRAREVRRSIGYMPERYALYAELTARELLEYSAAAYGLDRTSARRRAGECLEVVGLVAKADVVCSSLSHGMKQRLSLARTIVHDPPLLLLDEPSSGLDPAARVELREALRLLASRGKTILVSSHVLPELAQICTSVGIIDRGQFKVSGPIDQVVLSIQPDAEVEVEVEGDPARAAAILEAQPGVGSARVEGAVVVASLEQREGVADLVRALVDAGLRLRSFRERRATLEEVYLQTAAPAVS